MAKAKAKGAKKPVKKSTAKPAAKKKPASAKKTGGAAKRPVTAAEATLAKAAAPAKPKMARLFKVPAVPKDAPTPEEHRRLSFQAHEENCAKIGTMDEKSFQPHVGKTFTLTATSGETAKIKLDKVDVSKNPAPQMSRIPFRAIFSGPKKAPLSDACYELKAKGFDPVELHVRHIGYDGQGEKKSKKAVYQVAFA